MNKKYIIEVATNKASLEKLKNDLNDALQSPLNDAAKNGRVPELTRSEKAAIKNDLATLFGVAEHQADALRQMIQGIIPSDQKGIKEMQKQLEVTLGFADGIMKKMQAIGDATDWMKQGVSFVDSFSQMEKQLEKVQGIEKTVGKLTKTFEAFKDALAVTNSDAFLKRFSSATMSDAETLAKANRDIEKILEKRNKILQKAVYEAQAEEIDYSAISREEIEEDYRASIQIIRDAYSEIEKIKEKHKNSATSLYKDKEYIKQIGFIASETNRIKNMPQLNIGDIGGDLKASLKEATDSVKSAGNTIKNIVKDLQKEGIELAVTLPDPDAAAFSSKISEFITKTSEQFEKNPVKINVDLANPFKTINEKKGKETIGKRRQKQLDEANKEAERLRAHAAEVGNEVSDEMLQGLYDSDTQKIAHSVLNAFNKIYDIMQVGQKNITSGSKAWRKEIEKELMLKIGFDENDAKDKAFELHKILDSYFDTLEPLYFNIDTDAILEDIQDALKAANIVVDVKAGNIDGSGATIDATKVKLGAGEISIPQSSEQQRNEQQPVPVQTTSAITKNSEEVSELTHTQVSLKEAINQLQSSIDNNTERNARSEEENEKRRKTAENNASEIAKLRKEKDDLKADHSASNQRDHLKRQLVAAEEDRDAALKQITGKVTSVEHAFKDGDIEVIENEFNQAIQFLQAEKDKLAQSLENIKAKSDVKNKQKKIKNVQSLIGNIDKLLDPSADKEQVIIEALRIDRENKSAEFSDAIDIIQKGIQSQDRAIINTNSRIGNIVERIDELSQESNIQKTEQKIKQRNAQSKQLKRRRDNIQAVLDANENPVQLVFNEVRDFWKKSYRTIEKTKAELDDLKNGKYSDELKEKLKKLNDEDQKKLIQSVIASKNKRIEDWEVRQNLMTQMGLGSNLVTDKDGKFETEDVTVYATNLVTNEKGVLVQKNDENQKQVVSKFKRTNINDVLKSFTVESLTSILGKNPIIADSLLKNPNLKSLSSIQDIAYYAGVAQDALGITRQTEQEYDIEKSLQTRIIELAKLKAFVDKIDGMFTDGKTAPTLEGIESFIEFFEKVLLAEDSISTIVQQAREKIASIKESMLVLDESSGTMKMIDEDSYEYQHKQLQINRLQSIINSPSSILDSAKEYLTSFKQFAELTASDDRFKPKDGEKALTNSKVAQIIWSGLNETVRAEAESAFLKHSEFRNVTSLENVDVPGILDKMVKVFETGALNGIKNDNKEYQYLLALLDRESKRQKAKTITDLNYFGSAKTTLYDAMSPDKPIYVKVVGDRGHESVYDLHGMGKGRGNVDRSYSTASKSLGKFFRQLGIEDQLQDIVEAMFTDPSMADELIESLFSNKNLQLSNKPLTRTAAKDYSFDDTSLAKYEKAKEEIVRLETEIADLKSGKSNDVVTKSIENIRKNATERLKDPKLTQAEKDKENALLAELQTDEGQARILESIVQAKQQQLDALRALKPTQEDIVQALNVLQQDNEIDAAKLKDAKRKGRRKSKQAQRLTDDASAGHDYASMRETTKNSLFTAARQFSSNSRLTSQKYENPMQQIISIIEMAKEFGLMDVSKLEPLVQQYGEAYEIARSMPRIKDSTTPNSAIPDINNAWDDVETLSKQLINEFIGSDGWFISQQMQESISAIRADAEREKQAKRSELSASGIDVKASLNNIAQVQEQAKESADEYGSSLYEKYIREPQRQVVIALEQNKRAIESKQQEIKQKQYEIYDSADKNKELKDKRIELANAQEEELKSLHDARRKADAEGNEDESKRIRQQIKDVENKYLNKYNQIKKAWIDAEIKKLEDEFQVFLDSIKNPAMEEAERAAVQAFNADFANKGAQVQSFTDISDSIKVIIDDMYKEAAAVAESARASVDTSGVVSEEEINKELAKIEEVARKKIQAVLAKVIGKTDADLMAQRATLAAESNANDVAEIEARMAKRQQDIARFKKEWGITDAMLNGTTRPSSLAQDSTTAPIASTSNSTLANIGYGAYGGLIDTSDLAKEGTLRGIYELLNGGPPKSGWDDSVSESSKTHSDSNSMELSEVDTFVRDVNFAKSLKSLMDNAKSLNIEHGTLIGNGQKLSTFTSGKARQLQGEDVIRAIKQINGRIDFLLHNHPNGIPYPSIGDIDAARILAGHHIPVNGTGAYSDTGVSLMDFSGIHHDVVDEVIKKSISQWSKDIEKDGLTYDPYYKQLTALDDRYSLSTEEELAILSMNTFKKLYSTIENNFANLGYNNVFKTFTYDEIAKMAEPEVDQQVVREASEQVANDIIESGAQAAIEETKTPKSRGKLSIEERKSAEELVSESKDNMASLSDSFYNQLQQLTNKDNEDTVEVLTKKQQELQKALTDLDNGKYIYNGENEIIDFYANGYANADSALASLREKQNRTKSENKKNEYQQYINVILDQYKATFTAKAREYLESELQRVESSLSAMNSQPGGTVGSSVQETTAQVAEAIIESGSQAAVESAKQFTKDDIKTKQTALQEKFKAKNAETGRVEYSVKGASKIDQAFYNVGDRLNKAPDGLSDNDLTKLQIAYDQLTKGLQEDVINHLDKDTIEFLNTLKTQISSVLDANASRVSDKTQKSESIKAAKDYLSKLKTEDGKKVTGSSRASTGIEDVYKILDKDIGNLSDRDLTSLAQGYYRLQETVNHVVFEKLDENTKKVINDAIQEAKVVLDKYNVTIQGKELVGTVLDESNKDLFKNATKDRTKKSGKTIKSVAEPQITKGDVVISKASVYLGETAKKQAQEQAAIETKITEEKEKQNQLATEGVQQEAKATKKAQERVQTEQKDTKGKKKDKTTKPKTGSDSGNVPPSPPSSASKIPDSGNNQGGILGLLGKIAQESTLQSVLAQLSKGVKTSSGGKKGSKSSKKTDTVLSDSEALNKLQEKIKADYPEFASVSNSRAVSGGHTIDVFQYKNLDEIKEARADIAKLNAEGKAGTEEWNDAQQRLNALLTEQEKVTLKINTATGEITTKSSFQNLAVGAKAASKELQNVDGIISQLHDVGALSLGADGSVSSSNQSVQNYLNSLRQLEVYKDSLSQDMLFDPSTQQQLSQLTIATQNYRKEVMSLLKTTSQLNVGKLIDTDKLADGIDGLSNEEIKKLMLDIVSDGNKLETKFKELIPVTDEFGDVIGYQLAYSVRTGKHEVQEMTASLNPLTNELRVQKGAVKEVATGWQQFFAGLKGKAASIMQYLISITSIHDVFRYVGQGVQYVREIDGALTELKKVTDETDASYRRFLQDMSKTGSVIGATVTDLTTSAADWARLGSIAKSAPLYSDI